MADLHGTPAVMRADVSRVSGYYGGRGGEYTVRAMNDWNPHAVVGTYSDTARGGAFQTFCLEHRGHGSVPGTYYADITTYATRGGEGLTGSNEPHGAGTDPLDSRTTYLYTMFRQGTLDGYKYGSGRSGFRGSARALQRTIWAIETERRLPRHGLARYFYDLADAAVQRDGDWHGKGIGNVCILNLWGDPNRREFKQDTLVMVPPVAVPAPGAVVLGLIGLGSVGWIRRRFL